MTINHPKKIKDTQGNEFTFHEMQNGQPVYTNETRRGYKVIPECQYKHYTIIEK